MKKTLITLLTLAGVASAETTTSLLPQAASQALQKNNTYNYNWYKENWESLSIGGMKTVTDELMKNSLKINEELLNTGWRWSTGNRNLAQAGASKGKDADSFMFTNEAGHHGVFMLATRKLSDLLTQPNEELTSFSISFMATGLTNIKFSAWVWDSSQALTGDSMPLTLIPEKEVPHVNDNEMNEYHLDGLTLDSDDIVLFLWNAYDNKNTVPNYVKDLTSSYTIETVPEPATATLSLLALAGLAARRRRK